MFGCDEDECTFVSKGGLMPKGSGVETVLKKVRKGWMGRGDRFDRRESYREIYRDIKCLIKNNYLKE